VLLEVGLLVLNRITSITEVRVDLMICAVLFCGVWRWEQLIQQCGPLPVRDNGNVLCVIHPSYQKKPGYKTQVLNDNSTVITSMEKLQKYSLSNTDFDRS